MLFYLPCKNKKTQAKHTLTSIELCIKKLFPELEAQIRDSNYVGSYILCKKITFG